VIEATDGSVTLYPPASSKVGAPSETAAKGAVRSSGTPCAGVAVDAGVSLPVNTWTEAHQVALAWLRQRGERGVSVGRIRHVLRLYLVSIVEKDWPVSASESESVAPAAKEDCAPSDGYHRVRDLLVRVKVALS